MTWNYFVLLLASILVSSCLAHGDHGNQGVKGGQQGIKSYGGYFSDHGHGQGYGNNFVHTQQYHQPNPYVYQPYGWNFNQPQRTYGGVIQQNYPNNQQQEQNQQNQQNQHQQQGFGWIGSGNQIGSQYPNNNGQNPATFPKTPSLFLPNFAPPVYFAPNSFPYPSFPNYNPFQFATPFNNQYPGGNYGGQSQGQSASSGGQNANGNFGGQNVGGGEQSGHNVGGGKNQPGNGQNVPSVDTNDQGTFTRVELEEGEFATNAFFGAHQSTSGSDKVHREWTQDDESKWQATTKAPYFENKVPGLECTLPAAAVLGAITALKVSTYLPLEIPVGKPILSCNATQLSQAQINLDGIIYDCTRSAITMSCPRVDLNNLLVDECQGESLECDVRMPQNTRSVSCTNGTLISNHPIVCKSASLMAKKNVLNCLYKTSSDRNLPTTTRLPNRSTANPRTTARPLTVPHTSIQPPPRPFETNDGEDVVNRVFPEDEKKPIESLGLHHDVQEAIKDVFPHELLAIEATKMYLPPHSSMGRRIPDDLKYHMIGVFPHELFAMSQTSDLNEVENNVDNHLGLSTRVAGTKSNQNQASFTESRQSQWDINVNRNTGNTGTSFKTNPNRLPQRFGADDVNDRLIFTP